jgi:hypothetical protein
MIVREALTDILKPKELNIDFDRLTQDFLKRISVEDFEEYILDQPHTQKVELPNGNYVISTTDGATMDAIQHFALKRPHFNKIWNNLLYQFNYSNSDWAWEIIDKIYDAVANKFHLEW